MWSSVFLQQQFKCLFKYPPSLIDDHDPGREMENLAENQQYSEDLRDELDLLNLCFSLQSCTKNSTWGIGVAWIWRYKKKKNVEEARRVKQTMPTTVHWGYLEPSESTICFICTHLTSHHVQIFLAKSNAFKGAARPPSHTLQTGLLIVLPSGEEYGKLHDKEKWV